MRVPGALNSCRTEANLVEATAITFRMVGRETHSVSRLKKRLRAGVVPRFGAVCWQPRIRTGMGLVMGQSWVIRMGMANRPSGMNSRTQGTRRASPRNRSGSSAKARNRESKVSLQPTIQNRQGTGLRGSINGRFSIVDNPCQDKRNRLGKSIRRSPQGTLPAPILPGETQGVSWPF